MNKKEEDENPILPRLTYLIFVNAKATCMFVTDLPCDFSFMIHMGSRQFPHDKHVGLIQ